MTRQEKRNTGNSLFSVTIIWNLFGYRFYLVYCRAKKARISLEQAISEALEELEMVRT